MVNACDICDYIEECAEYCLFINSGGAAGKDHLTIADPLLPCSYTYQGYYYYALSLLRQMSFSDFSQFWPLYQNLKEIMYFKLP
jgi:hypothetical protein